MAKAFKTDFSGVETATGQKKNLEGTGASAATDGKRIAFSSERPSRQTVAHELAHVVQHQRSPSSRSSTRTGVSRPGDASEREASHVARRVSRGESAGAVHAAPSAAIHAEYPDSGEVCEVDHSVACFVLDPALDDVSTPESMTTHLRVAPPRVPGMDSPLPTDRYIALERPVLNAMRLEVYAVPIEYIFETSMEAYAAESCDPDRVPPLVMPGDEVWMPNADEAHTVASRWGDVVFFDEPVPDAEGAGVAILLTTEGGPVLVDAGMQLLDPDLAGPIGSDMADRIEMILGDQPLEELILSPGAPSGHLSRPLARYMRIAAIRSTVDQYDDGTVADLIAAQAEYRAWALSAFRDELEEGRRAWERTQPIAPNESIREARWSAHVEAEVAAFLAGLGEPVLRGMEADETGTLHPVGEIGPGTSAGEPGTGEVPEVEWEDVGPDEITAVYGDGRLTIFPARGFVLRADTPFVHIVEGLRSSGEMGLAPATIPEATPWVSMSAVGKEAQFTVRTSPEQGFIVDVGGRKSVRIRWRSFEEMARRLGVTSVEDILITHPHEDHVRHLIDFIKENHITSDKLHASASWRDIDVFQELRTTTDADLLALRYGPDWEGPQVSIGEEGATHVTIRAGGADVDVYGLGEAHRRVAAGGSELDSASLLYIFGNETSSARTAVWGDLRGTDITAFHTAMGEDAFSEALRNVRVIKGIGHHFSLRAGRTPEDIAGLDLLLEHTLRRNGELTIMVQSRESFSFGGEPTMEGAEGALLRYFVRQGARVIFGGRPGAAGGGSVLGSDVGEVTLYGEGVSVFTGADTRVIELHRRLSVLREARRMLVESPGFALTALDLEEGSRTPAETRTALESEIARLEGLATELGQYEAAELLESRGPREGGTDWTSEADREAFRAEHTTGGRTVEDILTDMTLRGEVEESLSDEVVGRLRDAIARERPLTLELEFAEMPRSVADAISELPEARRRGIAERYRELSETAAGRELIPVARHHDVLTQAEALRDDLRTVSEEIAPERRAMLESELARLDAVVERMDADLLRDVVIGHDVEGRPTRTEYIRMRAGTAVVRGFHEAGRVLGAVMVVHSIQGFSEVLEDAATGDINVPEGVLRTAHAAWGLSIGVRMMQTSWRQVVSGTARGVGAWEFVALAVLEIGAAAVADYDTSEERDAAVLGTTIHSSVNLLCMAAGQALMSWGAGLALANPWVGGAVMAIGFGVMMGGEFLLDAISYVTGWDVDAAVVRWTSFPPGEVTHVHQEIGEVLDEYRFLVGTLALEHRTEAELRALGVDDPAALHRSATVASAERRSELREKEDELMGLFEDAYERAQGAWVGLRVLDAQAAEFTRLRHMAMSGREDPARAGIERRFREIDERLDLSEASAETIRDMEQWDELDDKLQEALTRILEILTFDVEEPDYDALMESMNEAEMMMENARYRLDSASRGGFRPTALLPPGTEAHRVYVEMLRSRERTYSSFQVLLARIGEGEFEPVSEDLSGVERAMTLAAARGEYYRGLEDLTPSAALRHLQRVRAQYNERIEHLKAMHPTLTSRTTWENPETLAEEVYRANTDDEAGFRGLQLMEVALRSAARQASSSLLLAEEEPPDWIRTTVETEVMAAMAAIEARIQTHGLIFMSELDEVLEERGASEDLVLSAIIDAAYPASHSTERPEDRPRPFTEEEIDVLHSEELEDVGGGRLSSTAHQLALLREIVADDRGVPAGSDLLGDYDRLPRLIARHYRLLKTPYKTYETFLGIVYDSEHEYDRSLTPLVARTNESEAGTDGMFFGATYYRVVPLNADAVEILGTEEDVYIRYADLQEVTYEEILEIVATAGVEPEESR